MYQPTAAKSRTQHGDTPSPTVSVVFVALTLGLVALTSVVVAAPAVVAAFGAGVLTAVVVTAVHRGHVDSRDSSVFATGRPQ